MTAGAGASLMTRHPSPRLVAYLVIGAAGLFAGPALGRPEPVILVAPLLLAALVALLTVRAPAVAIEVATDADRVLEGLDVRLDVEVRADRSVPWLELAVQLPAGLVVQDGVRVLGIRLDAGGREGLSTAITARRWGMYRVGRIAVRARDRFGFFAFETVVEPDLTLRVFPRPETLQRLIQPAETQLSSGNEVSRRAGDGIEFATVRQYVPGDQVRRVNWRLSSRRPEVYVNELHPERSTDVVVLLDTFTDLGANEETSLASAVRGANGIADHYLRRRDRVGFIALGASIRWLEPGMGLGQAYRIVDALLDARAAVSFVWKGVELIPPRSLPPKALIVALSPLVDDRAIQALLDLRARGFDVTVVEVRPERFIAPAGDSFGATARRLWHMQRELLRDRFRRLGVPVAPWSFGQPLQAAFEEARAFRRHGRRWPA